MITLLAMSQDRNRANQVVDALVSDDLAVWGETAVPGEQGWEEALEKSEGSRCIIVCWSAAALEESDEADAYRKAALDSCARGVTIGVLLESVNPPEQFSCTLYDLSDWRLEPKGWRRLLIGDAYLRDVVAAARFKQANRDPPPPSAPTKLLSRQAALISSAVIVPLVGVLSFTDVVLNFERRMAAQPSDEELVAWKSLPPGDCAALRAFVRDFSDGAYRDRAQALLTAVERIEQTEWLPMTLREEIYLPHAIRSGEADARSEGARRCDMLVQGTEARNLTTDVELMRQNCETVAGSDQCDWRGVAICSFEKPEKSVVETCNL